MRSATERMEMFFRSDRETASPAEKTPPPSGRSSARKKRRAKNGKQSVNMTPPDKLLKKSEKKALRYSREKQVRVYHLLLMFNCLLGPFI